MPQEKTPVEILLDRIGYPPNSDYDARQTNVIRVCKDCPSAFLRLAPGGRRPGPEGRLRCVKCAEGKGQGWHAKRQNAEARAKHGVPGNCAHCSKSFVGLPNHKQKFCSKRCGLASKCSNRRALRRSVHTDIQETDRVLMRDLYSLHQGVCQLCRQDVPQVGEHKSHSERASVDHIIPLSKGGTHTHDNVQLAHLGCNSRKKDG